MKDSIPLTLSKPGINNSTHQYLTFFGDTDKLGNKHINSIRTTEQNNYHQGQTLDALSNTPSVRRIITNASITLIDSARHGNGPTVNDIPFSEAMSSPEISQAIDIIKNLHTTP
jgi:hypothetical protein